jgi:hypothetical protein
MKKSALSNAKLRSERALLWTLATNSTDWLAQIKDIAPRRIQHFRGALAHQTRRSRQRGMMGSQRDNRFEPPTDRGPADRFVPRYLWKCCAQFFRMSRRFDQSCDNKRAQRGGTFFVRSITYFSGRCIAGKRKRFLHRKALAVRFSTILASLFADHAPGKLTRRRSLRTTEAIF